MPLTYHCFSACVTPLKILRAGWVPLSRYSHVQSRLCHINDLDEYLLNPFSPKNTSECLKNSKAKPLSNAHKALPFFPHSFCHDIYFPIQLTSSTTGTSESHPVDHSFTPPLLKTLLSTENENGFPHLLIFVQIMPGMHLGIVLTQTVCGIALNVYKRRKNNRFDMMAHAYNPTTWESKARRKRT